MKVLSPVGGRVIPMGEVPDPVFAQEMVGPGAAVLASEAADAVSPVDGTVTTLHPHAFVVVSASGLAVLVHLGIDTVKLAGEGFTLHVSKGDTVPAGQPVIGWDPAAVRGSGYSTVCPVVALDASKEALSQLAEPGDIARADPLFEWRT